MELSEEIFIALFSLNLDDLIGLRCSFGFNECKSLSHWRLVRSFFFITQISLLLATLWALFTTFLTSRLICELNNLLNDWLESTSLTFHPAGYLIRGLIWDLQICRFLLDALAWFALNHRKSNTELT